MEIKTNIKSTNTKSNWLDRIYKSTGLRTGDILGLIGMVFIQGATLPVVYDAVVNGGNLPPLIMVVMVWVGLVFYNIRACLNFRYEWVYVIGNCIGLIGNGTLIYLILF